MARALVHGANAGGTVAVAVRVADAGGTSAGASSGAGTAAEAGTTEAAGPLGRMCLICVRHDASL